MTLVLSGCCAAGCSPPTQESLLSEIRAAQNGGDFEATIEPLRELIRDGRIGGEIMIRYARALASIGQPGRSAWALDAAMEDAAWIVPAAHQLALNAYQSGNYELCLQTLDRLEAERPEPDATDRFADLLRAQALIGTRRHYGEALDILDRLLVDEPKEETTLRLKGIALLGLERIDEAEALIEGAGQRVEVGDSRIAPVDNEAYWCAVRARFQRESKHFDEAIATTDACLAKAPGAAVLVKEAVELHSARNRPDRVLEVLESARTADPANRDARLALVAQLESMGRVDIAEATLRTATRVDESYQAIEAWIDLAVFLVNRKRVPEALEAYEVAFAQMDDAPSPELQFAYAEALIFAGRLDDALRVATETPVEIHRPMLRGRVAFDREDYTTALSEFEKAAIAWPNNAPIRYYLGRSAESLGDFDRAIEEYRHAIRSEPALAEARTRLVGLHIAEGRARHALAVLRFSSPREDLAPPTPAERLLQLELQVLLGQEPTLDRLPQDPERSPEEIEAAAIEGVVRGVQRRGSPEDVLRVLDGIDVMRLGALGYDVVIARQVDAEITLGRGEDAIARARRAIAERPKRRRLQVALADALSRSPSGVDEARAIYAKILAASPEDPGALHGLARVLAAESRPDVVSLEERALAARPGDPQILAGLVDALVASGRRAEAIQRLRDQLTRDDPYDAHAALGLAQLIDPETDSNNERRSLALRALRFGGGDPAAKLLSEIDTKVAEKDQEPAANEQI